MDLDQVNISLSEGRQELNKTDISAERREELLKKQNDLEIQYRNLLKDKESEKRDVPQELHTRASIGNYLVQSATGGKLEGAERELNEELRIKDSHFPLSMLLDRNEKVEQHRVDTASNFGNVGPSDQHSIVQRIFKRSDAAFLGVMMPSVRTGESNYPVITTGATGGIVAKNAAQDAEAATITANRINPRRLVARYLINIEDLSLISDLENSLRTDLRQALQSLVDDQILNGDGTAPNFTGITHSANNFFGAAPSAKSSFSDFVSGMLGPIDAVSSYGEMDLAVMIHPDYFKFISGEFTETSGGSQTQMSWLKQSGVRYRVSTRVPANTASTNVASILRAELGPQTYAVAPIWESAMIIRDQYTNASSGQIALTLSMLCGFQVVRSGYSGIRLKVA